MAMQRRVTLADRLREAHDQRHGLEVEKAESIKAKERNALDTKCLIAFWLFFIGCGTTVVLAEKIKPPEQQIVQINSSTSGMVFTCDKSNGCLSEKQSSNMWFDPHYGMDPPYDQMYQFRPYGKFWYERDLMGRNL